MSSPRFSYGQFAFVMATGIVSIGARLVGLRWISAALFTVNLVAFPLFWALLARHLCRHPGSLVGELVDHRRAPGVLAVVAASCVFGNEIVLMTSHDGVAAAVWIAALLLWAGLIYGVFGLLTTRPVKPQLDGGIDGGWLLVVVATEATAILTTRAGPSLLPAEAVAFASLCLFLLGAVFYVLLLILILYRWLFLPMRPDQLTPPYWINMGAAAIATLAGTRVLAAIGTAPAIGSARGFVFTATILFWCLASWWIPLLAALTLWRHRSGAVRLAYRVDNWSIVFPLGMYTTATWHLANEFALPFLDLLPRGFIWVALATWCLAFVGMVRTAMPRLFSAGSVR